MKKAILSMLAIASLVFATSCSDDDSTGTEPTVENQLPGNIIGDVTLDASKLHKLTGSMIVNSGATLTIPAGTKIEALAGGSSVYIAVLKGGKININGTAANPVVMSSKESKAGDWGGLVICGKASTTSGASEDGDVLKKDEAQAEVGGLIYGGTEDADNSGSLTYFVIRGAGANINPDSQYNGLSLYAVGSATKIENVSLINGDDDGVEFFGGSAVVKNIYLENNSDDSVDWTEGWNGTLENAYIKHTVAGFSTVFEGDKVNNNPTFTNITAVSTVGGTALQFKVQSGGSITGLNLEGYTTDLDMKDAGALSNVKVNGETVTTSVVLEAGKKFTITPALKSATKVDISAWTWKDATL